MAPRNRFILGLIGLGILAGLFYLGNWQVQRNRADDEPDIRPLIEALDMNIPHEVVYLVRGTTGVASITYATPGGGTAQQADINVPLVMKDTGRTGMPLSFGDGEFLYLAAQNMQAGGSVTCSIKVDGEVVAENTSTGGYVIATCDGST